MSNRLKQAIQLLIDQAKIGQPISYREFAGMLSIHKAPIIAQAASLLEQIIEQDAAQNRPIFSSLVVQKKGDIPRTGFFEKLAKEGITDRILQGDDAIHWHQSELEKIRQWLVTHEN